MTEPALVAVAHGTSDRGGRVAIEALLDLVCAARPVIAAAAYLDHSRPTLAETIADVGGRAIVVPLLLSRGYHVTVDVPSLACAAGADVTVTAPLGPHALVTTALRERLRERWHEAGQTSTSVVLAAAGSRDPVARADALAQAAMLGPDVAVGFLSGPGPGVDERVARLPRPVTIASYVLTSSRFHQRLFATSADYVTAPLAPHPALAELVLERYDDCRMSRVTSAVADVPARPVRSRRSPRAAPPATALPVDAVSP